jgi:putative sulfotransferase
MSADQTRILAEIAEMLRAISDSILPGEEIAAETRLVEDLGLASVGLAQLSGRIHARYGSASDIVSFLAGREAGATADLRVGELVDYLCGVVGPGVPGPGVPGPGVRGGNGRHPAAAGGDDTAVLATRLIERVVGRAPAPGRTFTEDGFTPSGMYRVLSALEQRFGTSGVEQLPGSLTVAELASYLDQQYGAQRAASLLRAAGGSPGTAGGPERPADGRRARNDNVAVLGEQAPDVARTLVGPPAAQVEVFMAGDGPPLILMHPINVGAGVFCRQFASLAGSHQLICMHNPGVGATTWDADLSLSGLARLQHSVLAELSVAPPFHVLGSSFGGLVAQEFALLYPAECASLVLAGCSYRAGGRRALRPLPDIVRDEFDRMHGSGADQTMEGSRAELEELLLRCESMDARVGLGYVDALMRNKPSLFAHLPEIAAPSLILRGSHDTLVPDKHAHLLYGAIPGAEFAELTDAGHFACLTHPRQVGVLLEPFLAARTGTARAGAPPADGGRAHAGDGLPRLAAATRGQPAAEPPDGTASPERCIILSSGRCGSTLLSDLIAEEPRTLSVYESLQPLRNALTLAPGSDLTGPEYWALLSVPGVQQRAMDRAGFIPREFRYPAGGRWGADLASIPPVVSVTLSRMSADPDDLFDVLAGKVPHFPSQPVGLHHKMLLDLLAEIAGRHRWVERSGASSSVAAPLLATFPEARFVYLTRNTADTALSMSKHPSFQLTAIGWEFARRYGFDPYERWPTAGQRPPDAGELPEEMRRLLPDQVTAEALRDWSRGLWFFEAMCAHMAGLAEQALADCPPRHLYRMRYEDLVARPADELTRLGEFLGFADPSGWARATADRVRPPHSRPLQSA